MLKIERKVLLWVEKHMFVLLAVLAAVMGLYLRRGAVWWSSPDAGYYFDGHEGNIQSGCYHLLVRLVQYLPMLPLHTVKWLAAAADYAVAVLAVIAVGGHREGEKLKSSFYFTGCIPRLCIVRQPILSKRILTSTPCLAFWISTGSIFCHSSSFRMI